MSKLKKNDKVQVLLGKDRGKSGTLERVFVKEKKVIVTGVNLYKRHVKRHGQTEGGIIEIAKPLDMSNVALVCPNCNKTTRVGFEIIENKKHRICRKCKKTI